MLDLNENDELKDLLKKKTKLAKDSSKAGELGDTLFQIGYLYYQKAYYKEALDEFERCLEVRKKLNVPLDIATTHRFLGETIGKLGCDNERAKYQLDRYYSMTKEMKDYVEIQRAETTMGNYFMALAEENYKNNRSTHLNQAFSHYLKSYEILTQIAEKKLVDEKEFGLMKARTCLNCAFAADEQRDLILCTEYLKTAIEICEKYHFYEDLIRCYYIKCDQAKRKDKQEEVFKVAERILEATQRTKDYYQQSTDFSFVADIYIKVHNFEKAKLLLRKAYKLRKKCLISPEIGRKLKEVMNVIKLQKELNLKAKISTDISGEEQRNPDEERNNLLYQIYEKLGDSYCNLKLFSQGLNSYLEQLKIAKQLKKSNPDIAVIYCSIAQTYQDLKCYKEALKFFELELKTFTLNNESKVKSLLNIAFLKEKCKDEFEALNQTYSEALEVAESSGSLKLKLKVLNSLNDAQKAYNKDFTETQAKIQEIVSSKSIDIDEEDEDVQEDDEVESIVFSSDSDEGDTVNCLHDEEKLLAEQKITRSKNPNKKYVVKRNPRGETQLHVACIKGNLKQVKKLLEEGHPVNERDNLNWLPIHEACNYGFKEIVELLISHGAKVNDAIGPITPLHDTVQNGHLEVAKMLLDAGAMAYTFTKDGYTPLDFLVKYKNDNESQFTPFELNLYKEIYDRMLKEIRQKDKSYVIKKVVFNEDASALTDGNNVDIGETSPKYSSTFKTDNNEEKVLYGIDDDDLESDSEDDDGKQDYANSAKLKQKKKKAIVDYKSAITSIGSKSLSHSKSGFSRSTAGQSDSRALITENEYISTDDWLIEDMAKSKANSNTGRKEVAAFTSGGQRNKRKHVSSEHIEEIDCIENDKHRIDDDNEDFDLEEILSIDLNATGEKSNSRKLSQKTSPLMRSGKDDGGVITIGDSEKPANNKKAAYRMFSSSSSSMSKKRILDNDVVSINHVEKIFSGVPESRKNSDKENQDTLKRFLDRSEERSKSDPSLSSKNEIEKTENSVVWKIKAVIDNRNFLIPVADINEKIDNLIVQILSRYKSIFSRDPSYREPTKVLLKSSEDLILFGEDLIKDVLTDSAQVHVIIEAFKDAPKIDELYDEMCKSNETVPYANVKRSLRISETSGSLELSELFVDHREILKQFNFIINSILTYSRQNFAANNQREYFRVLSKIDVSHNYLTDQMFISLIENIVSKCFGMKQLNFSNNMITSKGVKALNECNQNCLQNLEALYLNGNDLGEDCSSDVFAILVDFLDKCPNLKSLDLSDCKISTNNSYSQNMFAKFMQKVSTKNLKLDIAHNFIDEKIYERQE